jgi:predicted DNA binding CopG/RHH family protein
MENLHLRKIETLEEENRVLQQRLKDLRYELHCKKIKPQSVSNHLKAKFEDFNYNLFFMNENITSLELKLLQKVRNQESKMSSLAMHMKKLIFKI